MSTTVLPKPMEKKKRIREGKSCVFLLFFSSVALLMSQKCSSAKQSNRCDISDETDLPLCPGRVLAS